MDSTVYQNMKKDQERSSGTLPDLFLLICDVSVLLEIDQHLPFSVAFATGALDIAFILQSDHGAFDGSQRLPVFSCNSRWVNPGCSARRRSRANSSNVHSKVPFWHFGI